MTGFNVVVAQCDRIVTHIICYSRVDVFGDRVHIIEIVSHIVSLQNVSGIQEEDIVPAKTAPEAVCVDIHCFQGGLWPVGTEVHAQEASVHVAGGHDVEFV